MPNCPRATQRARLDGSISSPASSSTGKRLLDDVRTRLHGRALAADFTRSFSVRVKAGAKLSQVRFRGRHPQQRDRHTFTLDDADIRKQHLACPLVDGLLDLREGVVLRARSWRSGRDRRRIPRNQEQRRHRRQPGPRLRNGGFLGAEFSPGRIGGSSSTLTNSTY